MKLTLNIRTEKDYLYLAQRIQNFEKKVKNHVKKLGLNTDLEKIKVNLRRKKGYSKRTKTIVVNEDGTITKYLVDRRMVNERALKRARVNVYMKMLIENAFIYTGKSYHTIRKITNKQFMSEYMCTESEMNELGRVTGPLFKDYLTEIGLGKNNIADMLKDDLAAKPGNRDRLLTIAMDMWKSIDESEKEVRGDDSKKIIEMMKQVVAGKSVEAKTIETKVGDEIYKVIENKGEEKTE